MQLVGATLLVIAIVLVVRAVAERRQSVAARQHRDQQQWAELDTKLEVSRALHSAAERSQQPWNGYRRFRIKQKVFETADICSFYLVPYDGKPLPVYQPGQFLTIRCTLPGDRPGEDRQLNRCYSLSDAPRPEQFRITVKRVAATDGEPAGVVSTFLHDEVEAGDLLDARAPAGKFALDPMATSPAVLIAGGIGMTPLLSMANTILSENRERDVWLFYGTQNGRDHAMKDHFQRLARAHDNLHMCTMYSRPRTQDLQGRDFDRIGHLSADLIMETVTATDCDYYVCGPAGMMTSILSGLKSAGVSPERIHSEAFGPAAGRVATPQESVTDALELGDADLEMEVTFARSGRSHSWTGQHACLLDFAEAHGIEIDSSCRSGDCGTCQVTVREGRVRTADDVEMDCDDGCCLTCIAIPLGPVTLDA